MGRMTEQMIRGRAEHNEGLLSTLEEVALHQQGIERIEPLLARLCPRLRILYLQGNLICTIQHLHRLKDLEYLNLALNNVTRVQNLQRCESLRKLDLTANFVPKAALLGLAACLGGGHALRELHLVGNPCADWEGYRAFVVAALPQLERLDGQEIRPSERIAASQADTDLRRRLLTELAAEGVDADAAARCEDDGAVDDPEALLDADEVPETGAVDSESGELRRPWCPATRILEHHEAERAAREAEAKRRAAQDDPFAPPPPPPRHEDFPPLDDDADADAPLQRNEGRWEFSLDEDAEGRCLVLDVRVGRHLDTSLIRADVRPRLARLLVKGRLLQLRLPAEVRPDACEARRSKTTGALVLTMPLERPLAAGTVAAVRAAAAKAAAAKDACSRAAGADKAGRAEGGNGGVGQEEPLRSAVVAAGSGASGGGGDDDLPDL